MMPDDVPPVMIHASAVYFFLAALDESTEMKDYLIQKKTT
jgi:hypothetical protein